MQDIFEGYSRKSEYLLCVDSDGCAMDTMNEKHIHAFCPELIRVYGLEAHGSFITDYWMKINLFSATRGINRFKGLAATLRELAGRGIETEGWQELCDFAEHSPQLSNAALVAVIEEKEQNGNTNCVGLRTALEWSKAVNNTVAAMGDNAKPFEGCKEALAALHGRVDVAVVSSANGGAVEQEWTTHGLSLYTDIRLGQEAGSKAACIGRLLMSGYERDKVLMVGDALGDLEAARANGVLFYPILVGKEAASWERLLSEAADRFMSGTYAGAYEEALIEEQRRLLP